MSDISIFWRWLPAGLVAAGVAVGCLYLLIRHTPVIQAVVSAPAGLAMAVMAVSVVGMVFGLAGVWHSWSRGRASSASGMIAGYRELLEKYPDPLYLLDRQGRYVEHNEAACRMKGLTREQVIGRHILDFIPPEQHETVHARFKAALDGVPQESRHTLMLPDGRRIDVEVSALPLWVHEKVSGVYGLVRDVSRTRHMERRLTEGEQRYRSLFEHNPDGVFSLDTSGCYTEVNPQAGVQTGYPPSEVVGRHFSEFIAAEDLPQAEARFAALLRGEGATFEARARRRDGTHYHAQITVMPIVVDDEVVGVHGMTRDISAREATRRALAESRERYRSLFEHNPDAVYSVDPDGLFIEANDRTCELTGYAHDALIGRPYLDVVAAEDHERALAEVTAVFEGDTRHFGITIVRADNARLSVAVTAMPVIVDGAVIGVHGISQDISAREQARQALQDSEERYRAVFESSLDGILLTEPNGQVLAANAAACRMLGRSQAELQKLDGLVLTTEHDRPALRAALKERQHKGYFQGQLCLTRGDGSVFDAEVASTLFTGSQQRVRGSVVFRDVTARNRDLERLRLLESSVDRLNDMVIITRADELDEPGPRIVYVNPAFERMSGYTAEQVIGRSPRMLQGERTDRKTLATIRAALEQDEPVSAELVNYAADGTPYWIDIEITPVLDHRGTCTHYAAIQRDITERRRVEQELRLAAKALNNTAEGVMIFDHAGCVMSVNPAYTRITGYSAEEVLGNASRTQLFEENRGLLAEIIALVRQQGHWQGEFIGRRRCGESYPALVSVSSVSAEDGAPGYYVVVFNDISDYKAYEEKLEYLAHHDALTRLPNRFLFRDRLREATARARRHDSAMAVLFMDIDRFKTINDSLGHAAGDQLLRELAVRLQGCVRETDTLARLGGDEFTILLEELAAPGDAAVVARKIMSALTEPVEIGGRNLFVSASIGISCFPGDASEPDELMRNADLAMYQVKEDGRAGYRFYAGQMNASAVRELTMHSALHGALAGNEFQLHYQPIVDLATGQVTGVEALLRWNNAQLGLVSPADFIPLAEDTGLILPIGQWVLDEAIRELRCLRDAGHPCVRMAINLSARQFRQADLVDSIRGALSSAGLDPLWLELEITETMVMDGAHDTLTALRGLRELGVTVALDDFGMGYSSLGYLQRFDLNYIKIDKSFVAGIPRNEGAVAITRTIIAMAHGLSLRVIAEGVETQEQLDTLREWGCEEAQGYYLSVPLASDELRRLLANHDVLPVPSGSPPTGDARTLRSNS